MKKMEETEHDTWRLKDKERGGGQEEIAQHSKGKNFMMTHRTGSGKWSISQL